MKNLWIGAAWLAGCVLTLAEPEAKQWKAEDGTEVLYRWSAPETVENGKKYPLILFLHGAGERGTDNQAQLRHGVTAILKQAEELAEPCFLIAPQCPPERWWAEIDRENIRLAPNKPNALADALLQLVKESIAEHPVDEKRIYVTGLSMGGFATWHFLGKAPEMIAAAIPICGGGDPSQVATFKDVPVWAFHGEKDEVVPVRTTREMIHALERSGATPKVTYYPEAMHDSWSATYTNPEVIRWMFSQKK